jgi:hypothetical protein
MYMLCHSHESAWKLAVLIYLCRWQVYVNDKDVLTEKGEEKLKVGKEERE